MSQNDGSALLGRTVAGKYLLDEVIGTGGTGTVYRARQIALDRTVALKVLHPDIARDEQFVERFKREAWAASRLDHPNSVRVLDFGRDEDGQLYLAMEHVQGRTLHEVIEKEWPLGDARVVEILSQVLAALGVAHELGVIHRDLKPENIIILRGKSDEGESAELAKVCDFGIATITSLAPGSGDPDGPRMTLRGYVIGTPDYMSPEQVRGEATDQRSDLYSAGVVMYRMLTQRAPFSGESPFQLAIKHATEPTPPPSSLATVNPALEVVCLRAMSKEPADRYPTARAMRAALRAALRPAMQAAPASLPPIELTPPPAPRRRHPAWWLGGTALVAAALGVTVLELGRVRRGSAPVVTVSPAPRPPAVIATPAPPPPAEPAPAPAAEETATPEPRRPSRPARHHAHLVVAESAPAAPPPEPEPPPAPAPAPVPPPVATRPVEPPRPAPAPLDLGRASVAITSISTTSGIPGANIRAALARVPFERCYREALRARGAPAAGTAALVLTIDENGYVTRTSLQDAQFLPSIKGCIEQAARAVRVRDVDTGAATATVTLTFGPPS